MFRTLVLFVGFIIFFQCKKAQNLIQLGLHSHNDYQQSIPFWTAYESGLNSIEVDVFLKNDSLYVTHSESEIIKDRTIESLYLTPLSKIISSQSDSIKKPLIFCNHLIFRLINYLT